VSRPSVRPAPRGDAAPDTVEALLDWLGGATVLTLDGRDGARTRGLATLLHGNEPSGIRALARYLRSGEVPATRVVVLVGAVRAARAAPGFAHRTLPGARDLNRCFAPPWEGPEGEIAHEALRLLREARCEALVDLHNNTGHNPVYGVGTRADAASLNITALFGERYVVSNLRLGSLVEATAGDFPAVTIECGRAGDAASDAAALAGLQRYLALPRLETRRVVASRMTVFSEPIRVSARPGTRLGFARGPIANADLTLADDIDHYNFRPVPPGALVGWLGREQTWPLDARGADGTDVSGDLFAIDGDHRLVTRRSIVPIMMTLDPVVALADCLFYVVQVHEEIGPAE
jgi:Succinylglutamate desuccinylase / Aspartoacylase family